MLKRYFNRLASHRHASGLVLLLGIVLVLPSLAAGFFADDFTHYVLINDGSFVEQPDNISLFHLFSFVDTNPARRIQLYGLSIMPWWSSPEFSLVFFRPLSELTHYVDYHWLKTSMPLMHLHSIIWYGFLLALLAQFYKTFCNNSKIALLALLLFVADATHGFTVAWLANRNALLAAVFTLLAILAHHRFRETASVTAWLASLAGITGSFLSAEAGIVVGVFLFSYALFIDKSGPAKGLLYLLPALAIFSLWMGIYKHYHYGASGNRAYYIDPVESPVLFFTNLPDRLLRTLAMQFNPLPVHLVKPYKWLMASCGALYLLLLLLPLKAGTNNRYRFFLCILLLAIIPITSAELQDRNMLFIGIAACPLMANLIHFLSLQTQFFYRASLAAIIIFHLILSALFMLPTSYSPHILAQSSISTANSLPANISSQYVLSFGTPIFDACYLAAIRRTNELSLPQQFWNVTTGTKGLEIEKRDEHHFIISNRHGLFGGIDTMVRDVAFDPITPGSTIDLNGLKLTVLELDSKGIPTKARLDINPVINSGDIALYYWQASGLKPLNMPPNNHYRFH